MPFLLALLQYAPLVFGFVSSAENFVTAIGTKATGQEKLAAVTNAVVTAAPEIGNLIAADPSHSNHLTDYINGTVALMNSLNKSATGMAAAAQAQQAASSGA